MNEQIYEKLFHICENIRKEEMIDEEDEPEKEDIDLSKASLTDIGFNSFIFIRLIVEIEKEFDIEVDNEHLYISAFKNVDELCQYINEKMNYN